MHQDGGTRHAAERRRATPSQDSQAAAPNCTLSSNADCAAREQEVFVVGRRCCALEASRSIRCSCRHAPFGPSWPSRRAPAIVGISKLGKVEAAGLELSLLGGRAALHTHMLSRFLSKLSRNKTKDATNTASARCQEGRGSAQAALSLLAALSSSLVNGRAEAAAAGERGAEAAMATVKLLGPDIGNEPLMVEGIDPSLTILDLKERAVKSLSLIHI